MVNCDLVSLCCLVCCCDSILCSCRWNLVIFGRWWLFSLMVSSVLWLNGICFRLVFILFRCWLIDLWVFVLWCCRVSRLFLFWFCSRLKKCFLCCGRLLCFSCLRCVRKFLVEVIDMVKLFDFFGYCWMKWWK